MTGRTTASAGLTALLALILAAGGAPAHPALAARPPAPLAGCLVGPSRPGGGAIATPAGGAPYVPAACLPEPAFAAPFGGALAVASVGPYAGEDQPQTLRAVVLPSGDAYTVVPGTGAAGSTLEELDPAGRVVWSQAGVPGGELAADGRVVVVAGPYQALIVDLANHHVAAVQVPNGTLVQGQQLGSNVEVTVVGDLVVMEASVYGGMGESVVGEPGRVDVYNAQGSLLRSFALPDKAANNAPDTPADAAFLETRGNTAYLLYTDAPAGNQAGLFTLTAGNLLRGPYRLPSAYTDATGYGAMGVLPGGAVLADTWRYGGLAEATLVRPVGDRLRTLWRRSYAATGALVFGGTDLWAQTDAGTGGNGPGTTTLRALDWKTGRPVAGMRPIRDHGLALLVLAAGPWGLLAVARDPSYACVQANCADTLRLLEPDGRLVWTVALPPPGGPTWPQVATSPQILDIAGRDTMLLGIPGLAVTWGGQGTTPPGSSWSLAATPVDQAPAVTRGPGRAYQVTDGTTVIDAASPLVVTAAQAGKPVTLTATLVNAQGQALPSVDRAWLRLGDGNAGGQAQSPQGYDQVFLAQGQSSATFTYTTPKAGSYVITAAPMPGPGEDASDIAPTPPAFVQAGEPFTVAVAPWDANGVAVPLPSPLTMQVVAQGAVTPQTANAPVQPDGAYVATFTAGRAANTALSFTTRIFLAGQPYGNASGPAGAGLVDAPAPTGSWQPATGGVLVSVSPAKGTRPVGYAVYALSAGESASDAEAQPPLAVIDPGNAGAPAAQAWFGPQVAKNGIAVAALYATGALSPAVAIANAAATRT